MWSHFCEKYTTLHQQEGQMKFIAFCLTEMWVKQNRSLGKMSTVSNVWKSGRVNVMSVFSSMHISFTGPETP
jgi:hypothetical protein